MEDKEAAPEVSSLKGKTFDLTRMEKAFAQERLIRITEAEQQIKRMAASTKQSRQELLVSLRAEAVERLSLPARAVVEFVQDESGVPTSIKVVDPDPPEEKKQEAPASTEAPAAPLKVHKGRKKKVTD